MNGMLGGVSGAKSLDELSAILASQQAMAKQIAPTSLAPMPFATSPIAANPVNGMSEESIRLIVKDELERRLPMIQNTPVLQEIMHTFELMMKRSLSEEDHAAYLEYAAKGAPGLKELVESGGLDPIAELLWETISKK